MFIKITTDFKHGGQSYYAGEIRRDEHADLFISNGWAVADQPHSQRSEQATADVTLVVNNGVIGTKAEAV